MTRIIFEFIYVISLEARYVRGNKTPDKFTIRKYMIAPPLSIFMNVLTADLQILVNSRDIWP
jgi:hypothetical protein